jgi:hypothetical protein
LLRGDTCFVDILFDNIFSPISLRTSYLLYRIIDLPLFHYDLFGLDLLLHDLHLYPAFFDEILDILNFILQLFLLIQLKLEVFMLLLYSLLKLYWFVIDLFWRYLSDFLLSNDRTSYIKIDII